MNEPGRSELEELKKRFSRLEQELSQLAKDLKQLESQRAIPAPSAPIPSPIAPAAEPPPPVSPSPPASAAPPVIEEFHSRHETKPTEPVFQGASAVPHGEAPASAAGWPISSAPRTPASSGPGREGSFEMRLGKYWLVRVGIVMLLTAFVFFGNYAYQNFIIKLGPGGKVSLLYLASAILLGAGAWWQRQANKESLRNYAQVLFAGGLASVYFTTYAAHHFDNLRVIGSALLDGVLLLGWTGFMVWMADRKKSEVLALFAIGLAYYASVITRVGSFTLYSNLLLAAAAVFFLVRNRWANVSFVSLFASYAAYGYWRFFDGAGWRWASPEEALGHGTCFLASYWAVFTSGVFLSRNERFAGPNRATFLSANNVWFFIMFLLTMYQVRHGGFWKFSLIYGSVLLGLAELARRIFPSEPLVKNSYLTQGLLLVTIGLIAKFNGMQLGLLLGAESVVLLTLGFARKSFVLQTGAFFCGAMAVGWGMDGLERDDLKGLLQGAALGAMMAANAFVSHRHGKESTTPVRPMPGFFTVLALIIWAGTTWHNTTASNFPLALAVEALALTLSVHVLRVREFAWLGQGYLLIAHISWLHRFSGWQDPLPSWNAALMIALTLALMHWWQRQKVLAAERMWVWFWHGLYGLALVGVLHCWLKPLVGAPVWLALTSLLAVGITAYAALTRVWMLALCAQIFMAISAWQFMRQLLDTKPHWSLALAPIAALGVFSWSVVRWFRRRPDAAANFRGPLLQLALGYRWMALFLSLWWVCKYIEDREQTWVLALLGLLVFLWAGRYRKSEALLFSAAFTGLGLGLFWVPWREAPTVYWPNLFAILALLAQQRLAKVSADRYKLDARVHHAMIVVGGLSVWLLLTRWVTQREPGLYAAVAERGAYLTASWSALALIQFGFGIMWRERMYRWLGLGILAVAIGRVFVFDVWKLETLYRILSFMALGVVLLVLGFIYNKYQEKIKEWL